MAKKKVEAKVVEKRKPAPEEKAAKGVVTTYSTRTRTFGKK